MNIGDIAVAVSGMSAVAVVAAVLFSASFAIFGFGRGLSAADAKLRAYFEEHPEKSVERKLMQEAGYKV